MKTSNRAALRRIAFMFLVTGACGANEGSPAPGNGSSDPIDHDATSLVDTSATASDTLTVSDVRIDEDGNPIECCPVSLEYCSGTQGTSFGGGRRRRDIASGVGSLGLYDQEGCWMAWVTGYSSAGYESADEWGCPVWVLTGELINCYPEDVSDLDTAGSDAGADTSREPDAGDSGDEGSGHADGSGNAQDGSG